MKKLFLATIAAVALTAVGTAGAADLSRPVYKAAPPPPAPVYNWTGFYVGAGYGYGMYNADHVGVLDATGAAFTTNQTAGGRGWFGTVLVGGDYQFSERIVAGVFADYDFSRIKGDYSSGSFLGFVGEMKQTSAWAVGGRIGWLATPAVLTYVNGGYTQARFSSVNLASVFGGPAVLNFGAQTYSGYFIGGGVEYMFAPGWFAKTEYRYADYRSRDLEVFAIGGGATGLSERIHPYVQTIRSELVYKFNWGGPVVAKY
jgi:outer membrane immunogenic protein